MIGRNAPMKPIVLTAYERQFVADLIECRRATMKGADLEDLKTILMVDRLRKKIEEAKQP